MSASIVIVLNGEYATVYAVSYMKVQIKSHNHISGLKPRTIVIGAKTNSMGTVSDITIFVITEYVEIVPKYINIAGNTPICAEIVAQAGLLIIDGTDEKTL